MNPTGRSYRGLIRGAVIAVTAALALVAGGIAVLSGLLAAGDPMLSRQIVFTINRAIGTDSTRFTSDRVQGTLFQGAILENPRLLVRSRDGQEVTWAKARSLRIEYDLFSLLAGRPRGLRVHLDSPRLDLVHGRNGELIVPRFAAGKRKRVTTEETSVEIDVQHGGLSVARWDVRYGAISGHATLTLGQGRSALQIRDLAGSSEIPSRPGRLNLKGLIVAENGSLRADPLDIGLGASRVTARAYWDLAAARVREGTLSLHPLHVNEVFRALDIQTSEGILRGEVTFSGMPADGRARACLEGTYAGEAIDTLLLDARSGPGAVEISGLRLRVRRAEVTGSGMIYTRGRWVADLGFKDLNPALLPWWKSPEHTPQGILAGRARIEVRTGKPRPETSIALTLGASRMGRLEIERGFFQVHAGRNGTTSIDSAWVAVPGGRVTGSGSMAQNRVIQASVAGTLLDLRRLNDLLGSMDAASGTGRFRGQLTGTLDAPAFDAVANLYQARFENGLAGDTVTVVARGRLLPKLDLAGDVSVLGLRAGDRSLGDVRATVSGGRTLSVTRYRQTLGDTLLTLQGVIEFGEKNVQARVDSLALTAGEHHVRSRGAVRVTSQRDHLRISDLVFDLDPGVLEAEVDWNPARGSIDARGRIDGLDLSRLSELKREGLAVAGLVRGEFLATGPIGDPDISLRLEVSGPAVAGVVGDSLTLDLDYAPGTLNIQRAVWESRHSRISVGGSVRPGTTFEEWWRALGRRDRGWASRATLALQVTADSFDLALLAPADTSLRTLQGVASLRAHVTGTPAAPIIDAEGRAPRISYRRVQGEISALDLSYRDRRLRVDQLDIRQGGSASKIRGDFPVDLSLYASDRVPDAGAIALTLEVPAGNLSILPLFFSNIGASSGRIKASAEISGSPGSPRVTGSLAVTEGRVRLAGRDEIVEGITLEGTFNQERLTVTRFAGKQGKRGQLSGTGWWSWPSEPLAPGEPQPFGPRGEYEFKIQASDFTVTDREVYDFRITGTFDVVDSRNPEGGQVPWVTGRAVVTKGGLTLDLAGPPSEPREPLPMLYNVNVEFPGNFFYRNLDAEVELESEADVLFKNEGYGDLALGLLRVKGGKYYVFTREFRNLQGSVNFNSPDRIDPEVNIVGETTLPAQDRPRKVYLALTDRTSRLKVRVYDDFGTSMNDLLRALAFGQFIPGGLGVTTASPDASGVGGPISSYLFRNVERWLGSAGFIDTIDLRGSEGEAASNGSAGGPISVVGVGKYVTPQFYLKYSKDFSVVGEEQISADYRVTRHVLVKGQQIRRSSRTGFEPQEFNLDLKVRLEY